MIYLLFHLVGIVMLLGESLISEKFGANSLERRVSVGLYLLDSIAMSFVVLVVVCVIL